MKKNKKKVVNIVAIIIPVVAIIMAIAAILTVTNILKDDKKEKYDTITTIKPHSVAPNEYENSELDFTSETNYKGKLAQYPELYQIPFRKTDNYICNKDFYADYKDTVNECVSDATQFMETLFNVNYRNIASDKNKFVGEVMANVDYTAYHTEDLFGENEKTMLFYDYINQISDYFIKNQVQIDTKFYTDESLVYSDFYIFVRGELVFTVYSCSNDTLEYEIAKEYKIPMEVAMHRTPTIPSDHSIVAFGKADDFTFYMNP